MQFVVVGASRETGEDVELKVEAADENAARAKASRRGVLIASCTPDTSPLRPKHASVSSQPSKAAAPPPPAGIGQSETPNRLKPGEHDGFFDSTMLTLLRRQVQPEELLMVCDVQQPVSNIPRTMLLTPTRLMFLTVTNQHGQRMIGERREVEIGTIDQISVHVDRPKRATHDFFLIEIVTRDGIEAWVAAHSSGRRIVEAVEKIKEGKSVVPFIRTTEDVAEAQRASLSEGVPVERPIAIPLWLEPIILSNVKEIEDEQALRRAYRICLTIMKGCFVAVILGFVGLMFRLRGWQMPIGMALMIGPIILVVCAVNAFYIHAKLNKASGARNWNAKPSWFSRARLFRSALKRPTTGLSWGHLAGVFLPIAVCGAALWWGYSYYQSQMYPPLPRIVVTGNGANTVSFSEWTMEATRLSGVVRFSGGSGVELQYRITEGGVLKSTGVMTPHSGLGTIFVTREPQEVRIMLPSRPSPNMEVQITAIGD